MPGIVQNLIGNSNDLVLQDGQRYDTDNRVFPTVILMGGYSCTPPVAAFGGGVKFSAFFLGGYWGGTANFSQVDRGVHHLLSQNDKNRANITKKFSRFARKCHRFSSVCRIHGEVHGGVQPIGGGVNAKFPVGGGGCTPPVPPH